jgi:hypothetical protein
VFGKRNEIVSQIELARPVVFGVNGHDRRSNFASIRQHALKCIEQQKFANVAVTEVLADS